MHLLERPELNQLHLTGRFDAFAAPAVSEALIRVATPGATVVVDLSSVEFIDSTGLATLVQASLILRSPTDAVRVILELTRLDRAFAIEP
jgi:anti-sigma B factor antagonist